MKGISKAGEQASAPFAAETWRRAQLRAWGVAITRVFPAEATGRDLKHGTSRAYQEGFASA